MENRENVVTEIVGGESYCYIPLGEWIVRADGVCGGRPTFKYTRVEVAGVLERIADGESIDDIARSLDGYISREAIAEAVRLASRHTFTLDREQMTVAA